MESVTAVICVRNQHRWATQCIKSVADQEHPGLALVIVDDHSRPAFDPRDARISIPLDVVRNDRHLGYTKSANAGLKAAQSEVIILANSDVVFPRGALGRLHAVIKSGVDICSPLSNAASWQSVPRRFSAGGGWAVNQAAEAIGVETMSQIVDAVSRRDYPVVPLLNGFCLAIKVAVLNEIGLFDQEAFPVGYGEENDFCIRAGEAGFKCAIADDTYVYHAKSQSFGQLRRWWYSRRGGRALVRKWGRQRIGAMIEEMRDNPTLAYMRAAVTEELRRRAGTPI